MSVRRPNWSGSSTGLLLHCAWPAQPSVELPPRESNASADEGTDGHAKIERLEDGCKPLTPFDVNVLEWLPRYADGKPELAIAYNPLTDTAREMVIKEGAREHRDYTDLRDGEVPLTMDLCGTELGIGYVDDWKFGTQQNLDDAEHNGQMRIAAVAFARLRGLDSVTATLWIVNIDGTLRYKSMHTFDAFELDDIAAEMKGLWERIHNNPQPNPGPWCRNKWCSARAICPTTAQALVTTPLAPLSLTIASHNDAARIHMQLSQGEKFLEEVKRKLNQFVRENGRVELGDGTALEVVTKTRDTIVPNERALDLLMQEGFGAAITWKITKQDIEDTIKLSAPRGTAAKRKREVLEALEATGAVKCSTFECVDVVKPKKSKKEE